MNNISRRKFLSISATSIALSLLPTQSKAKNTPILWEGIALGAPSNMTLFHENETYSKSVLRECINEITRLENIFSLYIKDSYISRLNKYGQLKNPPKELVEVINFSNKIAKQTNGAFDISVQSLWNIHSSYYTNKKMLKRKIKEVKHLVNWKNIIAKKRLIYFKNKDMSITLNGIAQGYITDKITHLLEKRGFTNVLIDLGEVRAIGSHPDNRKWNISTPNLKNKKYISINNEALASSHAYGTKFKNDLHHLFNPKTGTSSKFVNSVSVKAKSAMLADALATALAVMSQEEKEEVMKIYPNVRIYTS